MTKKKQNDLSLKQLQQMTSKALVVLSRYSAILFFLLITSVYSFVVLRINTLVNTQPSQSDIDAQSKTSSVPRVDPKVAEQLQKLQDNSVNVQTLFNQARNNPFQ
jgi:hypothetical protein